MDKPANPILNTYGMRLMADMGTAATFAAETAARAAIKALLQKRPGGKTRQAGADTPMWNVLRAEVRKALGDYGAKTRLARHLGIPKQRLTDFVNGRRIPDGEIMLRLLHWLSERAAGRDPSTLLPDANPEATRKRLRRGDG